MTERRMTPNQLVAFNLRRARTLLRLTQEQAAERLEPYLGERWSKRVFSNAERSVAGERVRQFTADDLVAFAAAFDLPIPFFLATPFEHGTVAARGADKGLTPGGLAELGTLTDRHEQRIRALQEQHMERHAAELGMRITYERKEQR